MNFVKLFLMIFFLSHFVVAFEVKIKSREIKKSVEDEENFHFEVIFSLLNFQLYTSRGEKRMRKIKSDFAHLSDDFSFEIFGLSRCSISLRFRELMGDDANSSKSKVKRKKKNFFKSKESQ